MRKPTTAEMRANYIIRLAERSENYAENPAETITRARRAMTSFYRLAGFSERLFYINNDERLYTRYNNSGRLAEMEEREAAWIARVNGYLSDFHARAVFNGVYPSICDEKHDDDHGCIRDLFLTAWSPQHSSASCPTACP